MCMKWSYLMCSILCQSPNQPVFTYSSLIHHPPTVHKQQHISDGVHHPLALNIEGVLPTVKFHLVGKEDIQILNYEIQL